MPPPNIQFNVSPEQGGIRPSYATGSSAYRRPQDAPSAPWVGVMHNGVKVRNRQEAQQDVIHFIAYATAGAVIAGFLVWGFVDDLYHGRPLFWNPFKP